jgi:hydrogenase expression/formation protein
VFSSHPWRVKKAISNTGVRISEIGFVDQSGISKLIKETGEEELKPLFREAAYTKIKKIVGDIEPEDFESMKEKVQTAALDAIKKKDKIVKTINER